MAKKELTAKQKEALNEFIEGVVEREIASAKAMGVEVTREEVLDGIAKLFGTLEKQNTD